MATTPPNGGNRNQHKPLTEAKRRKVIALCEAGKGRNDIARETGIGLGTVSKIIKEAGLSFDRTATRHATAAKKADNAAVRAELAGRLLVEARGLLDEMHAPFLAFNIGGKDNVYTEHKLLAAPTSDKRNLMMAASTAMQRHLDLERHDADAKAADARSMLVEFGKALGIQPVDSS